MNNPLSTCRLTAWCQSSGLQSTMNSPTACQRLPSALAPGRAASARAPGGMAGRDTWWSLRRGRCACRTQPWLHKSKGWIWTCGQDVIIYFTDKRSHKVGHVVQSLQMEVNRCPSYCKMNHWDNLTHSAENVKTSSPVPDIFWLCVGRSEQVISASDWNQLITWCRYLQPGWCWIRARPRPLPPRWWGEVERAPRGLRTARLPLWSPCHLGAEDTQKAPPPQLTAAEHALCRFAIVTDRVGLDQHRRLQRQLLLLLDVVPDVA